MRDVAEIAGLALFWLGQELHRVAVSGGAGAVDQPEAPGRRREAKRPAGVTMT